MLSIHDYTTARVADQAGLGTILVGDSLVMTALGHKNTISVTMDEMLHHTKIVARAAKRRMVITDMPFMSYHTSLADAVRNAGRFLQEAGADSVKIEGGRNVAGGITDL